MGFDVTYHPMTREEMFEWYFDPLRDDSAVDRLAAKYGFLAENFRRHLNGIRGHLEESAGYSFELSHGLMLAATQGLFRRYDYFRGSLVSSIIESDPRCERYTESFREIVPEEYKSMTFSNGIECNFCGGVYIPPESVAALILDIDQDPGIREDFLEGFGDREELDRFLDLLSYARENRLGILEATDVVVPMLNSCSSEFDNCVTDFMERDKENPSSRKPLSLSPFLTEPYDPEKEPYAEKYYFDGEGEFCENKVGGDVWKDFEPTEVEWIRTNRETVHVDGDTDSVKTEAGEWLEIRLMPQQEWGPMGCWIFWAGMVFSMTALLSLFLPLGSPCVVVPFGLGMFCVVAALVCLVTTRHLGRECVQSFEIERHPVPLDRETKIAVLLNGPKKLIELKIFLYCEASHVSGREFMPDGRPETAIDKPKSPRILFGQALLAAWTLHLGREPRLLEMKFCPKSVPSTATPEWGVRWFFEIDAVEPQGKRWKMKYPFVVEADRPDSVNESKPVENVQK